MEQKICLKCGRDCQQNQAFCEQCLEDMARHPVKPGVVVLLPQADRHSKPQTRRRPAPSPEERLAKLKKRFAALWLALILSLSAAGLLGWWNVRLHRELKQKQPLPGQNYSSETPGTPSGNP